MRKTFKIWLQVFKLQLKRFRILTKEKGCTIKIETLHNLKSIRYHSDFYGSKVRCTFPTFHLYSKVSTLNESKIVSEQMAICIIKKKHNTIVHVTVDLVFPLRSCGLRMKRSK